MIRRVSSIKAIQVQPIGGDTQSTFLRELAGVLANTFRAPGTVRDFSVDASFSFDVSRGQYYSTAILQQLELLAAGAEEIRLLGVTELDLFVPVLTFVFGEAQLQGRCAVFSLHRLREEFYGLPANQALLKERAIKEAVHELGHTFGLRHCADWRCVMASTHAVERLDLKGTEFCPSCRRLVFGL